MKTVNGLAAAALLVFALAGCTPGTTSTDTGTDGGTDTGTDSSDGGFAGVTLPGTGSYAVPAEAAIGGYELADEDSQPAGCTWSLLGTNGEVISENTGSIVFLTDVTATFTTNGCPDWVQFE